MNLFSLFGGLFGGGSAAVAEPEDEIETAPEPEPAAPVEPIEYGEVFGKLTRFGEIWIELGDMRQVNFVPKDGCGAELTMTDGTKWHFPPRYALALKLHMMAGAGAAKALVENGAKE